VPVLSAMRMSTPIAGGADPGTASSNATPRHSPRVLTDRNLLRPSTPRSQTETSQGPSRQSSGQQPSLSGSVLQPANEKELEASMRSSSALSLHSDNRGAFERPQLASSASAPMRPRLGAPPGAFGLVGASTNHASSYSGMPAVAVDTVQSPDSMVRPQALDEAAPDMIKSPLIGSQGLIMSPMGTIRTSQEFPDGMRNGTPRGGTPSASGAGGSQQNTPRGTFPDVLPPGVSQMVQGPHSGSRPMMTMAQAQQMGANTPQQQVSPQMSPQQTVVSPRGMQQQRSSSNSMPQLQQQQQFPSSPQMQQLQQQQQQPISPQMQHQMSAGAIRPPGGLPASPSATMMRSSGSAQAFGSQPLGSQPLRMPGSFMQQ